MPFIRQYKCLHRLKVRKYNQFIQGEITKAMEPLVNEIHQGKKSEQINTLENTLFISISQLTFIS